MASTNSTEQHQLRHDAPSKPHVAVIGAGLAGLRCADLLLQHGFKVTVIEGRDRVGGRVHQEKLANGVWADCGPNWIHGTDDNPILDLAKQTETAVSNWDTMSHVIDEAGKLLTLDEGDQHANVMWEIVQAAFEHSNKSSADISKDESLLDFFHQQLKERIPDDDPECAERRKMVLQYAELWGAFIGTHLRRQSLKFFWLEECIEGENLFCAGTYRRILETIAKPALAHANVELNTTVQKITYNRNAEQRVSLQTAGGQTLSFDEVVVTAPLGWLKRNLSAFEPPLPARLTKGIGAIGYGCLEKIYITFPKAFWLPEEGKDHEVQGFIQWLAPNYDPKSNPDRWNQECVELASLEVGSSHSTLLFYTYGEQSEVLTSKTRELPDEKSKTAYLLGFFRPYYSRLPNYDETSPDCAPIGCMATDWLYDDLAGNGSYSNFQVGLEEGDEDIKTMREGLPDQGLWFAGEHTAPFVGLGTATGAYWSGESVGIRIAEAYGRSRQNMA